MIFTRSKIKPVVAIDEHVEVADVEDLSVPEHADQIVPSLANVDMDDPNPIAFTEGNVRTEQEMADLVGVEIITSSAASSADVFPTATGSAGNSPVVKGDREYGNDEQFDVSYIRSKTGNRAFAGVDIVPSIVLPNQTNMVIGDIQTLSISSHSESFPVRTHGRRNPIGFTNGPRTVAGTMIFSLIDIYPWYKLIRSQREAVWDSGSTYPLADSLPPFDVTITFHNEYEPHGAIMRLFGVKIMDDGVTLSIDDLVTENTFSYVATAFAPLHQSVGWDWREQEDYVKYDSSTGHYVIGS